MEFFRPEYWSGYSFPSPGDLPNPGIEPRSLALQADSLPAEPQGKPKNTGVGSQSLLQWIFLTQEWDQDLKKLNKWFITFQSNRPRWIHWWINCAKCLRKKFTNYLQSLSEERREGILSNSFYEASISLVAKPDKNITRKDKYKMISLMRVAQSYLTLCNPTNYTVHGILQARILEWVAFPFSRRSSQLKDQTQVSRIAGGFFTSWATREAQECWSG